MDTKLSKEEVERLREARQLVEHDDFNNATAGRETGRKPMPTAAKIEATNSCQQNSNRWLSLPER